MGEIQVKSNEKALDKITNEMKTNPFEKKEIANVGGGYNLKKKRKAKKKPLNKSVGINVEEEIVSNGESKIEFRSEQLPKKSPRSSESQSGSSVSSLGDTSNGVHSGDSKLDENDKKNEISGNSLVVVASHPSSSLVDAPLSTSEEKKVSLKKKEVVSEGVEGSSSTTSHEKKLLFSEDLSLLKKNKEKDKVKNNHNNTQIDNHNNSHIEHSDTQKENNTISSSNSNPNNTSHSNNSNLPSTSPIHRVKQTIDLPRAISLSHVEKHFGFDTREFGRLNRVGHVDRVC